MPAQATAEDFDVLTATGVTLVDFWAPWCGPCRMQGPILDELAGRAGDAFGIVKVNVDDAPELGGRFGISAIPCLVVLSDGVEVERMVGVQSLGQLVGVLRKYVEL